MASALTLAGLLATLLGAGLLFFYGMPQKKVGNVMLYGNFALKHEPDPGQQDVPDSEWKPVFDVFAKRARRLNKTGFGLVAAGTLLQVLALSF
jgi:hypothetical protein